MSNTNQFNDKFYEGGFFANYKYWVRYYDPVLDESFISSEVPQKWEYYEEHEKGDFSSVYDNKRYLRKTGSSQDARNHGSVSPVSPVDVAIRDLFMGKLHQNPRIMYLDIETHVGTVAAGFPSPEKALEPVSLIQFLDSKTQKVHIIGDREFYYKEWYLKQPDHLGKEVVYHHCNTESEMFDLWFKFLAEMKPAVVYAWNGEGFDFGYLFNRCKRIGQDTSRFCPFWEEFGAGTGESKGYVSIREQWFNKQYTFDLKVGGCYYIDIKRLYQKMVLAPRQSYSLNNIAMIELKSRKIEHSEFKTFEDFYQGNYQQPENPTEDQASTLCYLLSSQGADPEEIRKAGHGQFVYYGVIDVVLLQAIDHKTGLTALMCSVSNRVSSQYNSILGTTTPWANNIRNRQYFKKQIIVPETILQRGADLEKHVNGGYVRDPEVGKHEWVISEDVNSMYPLLSIAGSNMSPDTFIFPHELPNDGVLGELKQFIYKHLHIGTQREQDENNLLELIKNNELKQKLIHLLKTANLAMAPNGALFKKDHGGFVPAMVSEIYAERKQVKKSMFQKEQLLIKIEEILQHREQGNNNVK